MRGFHLLSDKNPFEPPVGLKIPDMTSRTIRARLLPGGLGGGSGKGSGAWPVGLAGLPGHWNGNHCVYSVW